MAKYDNAVIAASTPRMGNWFTRGMGSLILKLCGWKIVGSLPDKKKLLIIGMPHTSNWDFVIAMAAIQAVGLKISYMMKKEAFFWPLGGFFKWMGGVPIDRARSKAVPEQMADWFNENENVWLGITPEGTRSKVDTFKTGYLKIAYAAQVPIFAAGFNGATKELLLTEILPVTGDIKTDNEAIKAFSDKTFVGIRPDLQ